MGGTMWVESDGPGPGLDLPLHDPRAAGRRCRDGTRRDFIGEQPELAGQARAGGRRQRHQPAHPRAAGRQVGHGRRSDTESPGAGAATGSRRASASTWRSSTCTCPRWTACTLAARIREAGHALPLVLFSSLGRREAAEADALFAATLAKPLRQCQLFDTLVDAARRTTRRRRRRADAGQAADRRHAWPRATRCASCSPRTTS